MKLAYPVSKSHMAFLFNVETLFEYWPNSIYMWTFTMKHVYPDFRVMMYWNNLMKRLIKDYPLLRGLRVVEVHPGKVHSGNIYGLSHGLHFHCLFNQRVPVRWLLKVSNRLGFGRIHVCKVTKEEAKYIAKYLTKQQPALQKGCRRWGTIGWTAATRVKDVEIDSAFHRNVREVQNAVKQPRLSADVIHSIYVNTRLHGDFKNWPIERYYYSGRARRVIGPDEIGIPQDRYPKPTRKLPESNKRIREQSMQRQAAIWKERARLIAMKRT